MKTDESKSPSDVFSADDACVDVIFIDVFVYFHMQLVWNFTCQVYGRDKLVRGGDYANSGNDE